METPLATPLKNKLLETIENIGPVDLVIYSVASPRRIDPDTGQVYNSVLKPIGKTYCNKTVDPFTGVVKTVEIEPATSEEILATEKVMGGEDWTLWMEQLMNAGLLADKAITIAYSYIGPELTHPIYKDGTIGAAKKHLHATADMLNKRLAKIGGRALISINKALVTQASAAIPVVPLYISLIYKIMKQQGTHEGCIEQIVRLFKDKLYIQNKPIIDDQGFIRLDDWEMASSVQVAVQQLWQQVTTENIQQIADLIGYQNEFYHLFGFGFDGIDYQADCNPEVNIPSIN